MIVVVHSVGEFTGLLVNYTFSTRLLGERNDHKSIDRRWEVGRQQEGEKGCKTFQDNSQLDRAEH